MATPARAKRLTPSERYEQLLPVAEDLFTRSGYAAVSMEDIARAAGVTRPVVYDHFGSKEGAYVACVERARAALEAELTSAMDPSAPPREQLRAGGDAFFAMLERDPARWRLLFGSSGVLGGTAADQLAELRFQTIERIRVIFTAMAPDAPADRITACAHVVSGAGERLGHWWLARPDLSRQEIVDHYVEICWAGLQPWVGE